MFPVFAWYSTRFVGAPAALALVASVVAGGLVGLAWTLGVAVILGGWIGAFSFPVLLCWITGAAAAFSGVSALRHTRLWLPAIVFIGVLPAGMRAGSEWAFPQPPDAVVYFKPGTTRQEMNYVMNEVLSRPHSAGRGFAPLEGISSLGTGDGHGGRGLRVSFWRGVRKSTREAILSPVRELDVVAAVVDEKPVSWSDIAAEMRALKKAKP
jgi:hypothetical protein